ncbi:MAG TPA: hypothetical protein VEC76_01835 [Streptosporangiaceae bacterium]|nr:hypothetical protein [Streptosporangiaceae bacterium]
MSVVLLAARRGRARRARAAAAVMLAGLLATGCAHRPAGPPPPSVESCTTFGISALKRHVTVTSLPAACQGLTRAQVNFAVGRAIYAISGTVHGKARRRALALKLSPLLAQLVSQVPPQRGPAVGAAPARKAGGPSFRLLALISWLVTAGLGAWMLAQWVARGGLRRAGPGVLPPQLTVAHFGLALAGLLAWIIYLATGLTAVAWTASAILLPVAGLGMALVLWLPERRSVAAAVPAARAVPAGADVPAGAAVTAGADVTAAAGVPAAPGRPGAAGGRHPPAVVVAAHGVFAVATILFAFLAAVGTH